MKVACAADALEVSVTTAGFGRAAEGHQGYWVLCLCGSHRTVTHRYTGLQCIVMCCAPLNHIKLCYAMCKESKSQYIQLEPIV